MVETRVVGSEVKFPTPTFPKFLRIYLSTGEKNAVHGKQNAWPKNLNGKIGKTGQTKEIKMEPT